MTTSPRHICAVCGRHERIEKLFHSSTKRGTRFCRDLNACDKRAVRRARKLVAA